MPYTDNGGRISPVLQLLAILAILVFPARASAQKLEPAWEWSAPAGIEWVTPVGGERPSAILAATRDGKLHQFHIMTGTPRFADPIAVGKAARFISASDSTAFICDESEIIGVSIQSGPPKDRAAAKVLWRTKVVGEEMPAPDGDPEFRARLLAAISLQTGVLAARSDGRIAELRQADGAALWSVGVPSATEIRLFSDDFTVCALHRGKKGINATLIDRKAPNASAKTVDFADAWPMLTEWTGDGLIAAWPNRVLLLTGSGESRRATLNVKWPIKSDRVGVLQAVDKTSRPLLAILDGGGRLSLHDAATGETVWEQNDKAFRNGRLEISGPHVLVLGENGVLAAFHRDSPEQIARCAARDFEMKETSFGDWRAAAIVSGGVVAAFTKNYEKASNRNPTMEVVRSPSFRPGEWSSDRAKTTEKLFSFGTAIGMRKIAFSPGRVIVSRERSIQVFVIQTE